MSRNFATGLVALGAMMLAGSNNPAQGSPTTTGQNPVISANNGFCFRVLKEIDPKKPDANVLLSPISVSQALTMVLNGAGGVTRTSIASALGLTGVPAATINSQNRELQTSLNKSDPTVQISVANALWADKNMSFAAPFRQICRQDYGADARTLDFASPDAASAINGWVDKQTQGHIDNIVKSSDLTPGGSVLTNAIYFHGKWTTPFDLTDTGPADFTQEDGSKVTVQMMRGGEWTVPYFANSSFQAVALSYGKSHFSIYLLLPATGHAVESLISGLNRETWQTVVDGMSPTSVQVDIPKFKANYSVTLNAALSSLGMGDAFRPGANFVRMGMPPRSCIGAVLQKATLDVDEEGTTATAATAVVMRAMAIARPRTIFIADHPFFYAIRDNDNGAILFAGIVRDPKD